MLFFFVLTLSWLIFVLFLLLDWLYNFHYLDYFYNELFCSRPLMKVIDIKSAFCRNPRNFSGRPRPQILGFRNFVSKNVWYYCTFQNCNCVEILVELKTWSGFLVIAVLSAVVVVVTRESLQRENPLIPSWLSADVKLNSRLQII